MNGATMLPFDVKERGFAAMAQWLAAEEITIIYGVPSLLRHFAAALPGTGLFPRLRLIALGGEPLLHDDVKLFRERFTPGCVLINLMGLDELASRSFFDMKGQRFSILTSQLYRGR